jgi:HAMP domain-containing protein
MAQQAEQEIAEADRELQRARSYNQSGITADTTAAQEQLADARQRLAAQDYEGTIEAANAAERAARMAWGEAERQANEVRRQADWQRRKERVDQVEQWLESTGTAAIRFLQRLQR